MGRLVGVLSHLGGVLRRLGAVLGRLGVVLGRLGSVLQAPERETMNFQWFLEIGGGEAAGASWTRYGRGFRSGPLSPKIKPNTLATGTGLGCLVSGLSPVHVPGLLGVSPLTSTGAWAEGVCCLTLTHAVARSAVADN